MDAPVLHAESRRADGRDAYAAILDGPAAPAVTPIEESSEMFLFAEVWSRPILSRRGRFWISLSCLAHQGDIEMFEDYVGAVLRTGIATLPELREFVLHFAVYCGWPRARMIDRAVTRVATVAGLADTPAPLQTAPHDPVRRMATGAACYESVMTFPPPPPNCPFYQAIHQYVFGEMWDRPGLDRVSRRWITLACVSICDTLIPIRTHVYAALNSGQVSPEEMQEFVLHFATYAGWPKASLIQTVANEMIDRVAHGLDYV